MMKYETKFHLFVGQPSKPWIIVPLAIKHCVWRQKSNCCSREKKTKEDTNSQTLLEILEKKSKRTSVRNPRPKSSEKPQKKFTVWLITPHYLDDEARETKKLVQGLNFNIRLATLFTKTTTCSSASNQALHMKTEIKLLLKTWEKKAKEKTGSNPVEVSTGKEVQKKRPKRISMRNPQAKSSEKTQKITIERNVDNVVTPTPTRKNVAKNRESVWYVEMTNIVFKTPEQEGKGTTWTKTQTSSYGTHSLKKKKTSISQSKSDCTFS